MFTVEDLINNEKQNPAVTQEMSLYGLWRDPVIYHMLDSGVVEAINVGPMWTAAVRKPRQGDYVVIKAGAEIRSYNPSKRRYKTVRRQRVRVTTMFDGYLIDCREVRNAEVSWPGQGGYWCHVDVNDLIWENGRAVSEIPCR